MLCEHFRRRMNQRLDNRQSLESDPELMQHAESCASCRAAMDVWAQITSVIRHDESSRVELAKPGASQRVRVGRQREILSSLGLAAAVLLAVVLMWDRSPTNRAKSTDTLGASTLVSGVEAARSELLLAQVGGVDVDPSLWWRSVQERDWVEQTMPAVRQVSEGVAPLGRSLRQAVTILTIGGSDQTS